MRVRVLDPILDVLEKVYMYLSMLFFFILMSINVADIFRRLVTGKSIIITEELSILCFSWMVFLGMAVVLKRNIDPKITIFLDQIVAKKYHRYFDMIVNALIIVFVVTVLYIMIGYLEIQGRRVSLYLPIQYLYFSLPIVFSFFYILLFSIRNIIELIKYNEERKIT